MEGRVLSKYDMSNGMPFVIPNFDCLCKIVLPLIYFSCLLSQQFDGPALPLSVKLEFCGLRP